MRAILLAGSLCLVAGAVSASITNVTQIAELSTAGVADWEPRISSDERTIVFYQWDGSSDYSTDRFLVATRTSPTEAFDAPTSAPFLNVLSSSSEGSCWLSDDGLRFYFTSDRSGNNDLYYSERASTAVPFPAPSVMSVSDPVANDRRPVLANNELSIYFISERAGGTYYYSTYRATRSSLTEAFGTPQEITTIDWNNNGFLTVSNDELTLLTVGGSSGYVYAAARAFVLFDWPTPSVIHESMLSGASLNGDRSRVYFSDHDYSDPLQTDLFVGDFSLDPPGTPTPTPTPVFPSPVPDIDVAVSRLDIGGYTGTEANPFGAAFDSQGRLIFFDQEIEPAPSSSITVGTHQLLRVTQSGGAPVFETLVTKAQLTAHNAAWGSTTTRPVMACVEVLSDDSIVLLVIYPGSYSSPMLRIERVVPGTTPAITTVATLPNYSSGGSGLLFYPLPLTADRSVTPNILYFASMNSVYRVTADQVGATVTTAWATAGSSYAYDLVIDENGDVLVAGADLSDHLITRLNKTTGALSNVVTGIQAHLAAPHYATTAMAINPLNGDLFALYKTEYFPYPRTNSRYNVFRMVKNGNSYTVSDYVTGHQVFNDPDVSPFGTQSPTGTMTRQLTARGNAFAISPDGRYLYIGGGMLNPLVAPDYYTYPSNASFVRISTDTTTAAGANWTSFE